MKSSNGGSNEQKAYNSDPGSDLNNRLGRIEDTVEKLTALLAAAVLQEYPESSGSNGMFEPKSPKGQKPHQLAVIPRTSGEGGQVSQPLDVVSSLLSLLQARS